VNQRGDTARAGGIEIVIPPKRKQTEARTYDTELYKERHLIEHVFLWLKQYRGIALAMLNALIPFLPLSISDISSFLLTTLPRRSSLSTIPQGDSRTVKDKVLARTV
jgi:transposase